MLGLAHLYPLTVFSVLVSSQTTPALTPPSVYNNCSGDSPFHLPSGAASTPYFKPQIPTDRDENGAGWEEWVMFIQGTLEDGSDATHSYKWSRGDPTSANLSHSAFSAWAYFPNGTLYHQTVQGAFKYGENADGGFTCSIANNHLTWDPVHGFWNASINAEGLITETQFEVVEPAVPFSADYKSIPGQISDGFFSRMDAPRGHTGGYIVFPSGLSTTTRGIGSIKHTWSHKIMADTLSAYVRGTLFLPNIPPNARATLSWYQAWDPSGKEVDSMQFSLQPDGYPDGEVFRIRVTDTPEILSIVTTPTPTSLPLTYNSTELTLPLCGPGADFENTHQEVKWKMTVERNLFNFVDSAGGVTLYQRVNVTGVVWANGTSIQVSGGIGIVEVYHP